MNIFYLHDDPHLAASYVYDKHKVKMILESAQMLCTAHHALGNGHNAPYKKSHLNHPSTIWVRENALHYDWLWNHMIGLGREYTKRYGKHHLSIRKMIDHDMWSCPLNIPYKKFERPPQCMPDEFKRSNAIHGYWTYYIIEKAKIVNKNETPYTFNTIPEDVGYRYGLPRST